MIVNGYEILIVSPSDREYLVAEITKGEDFFAELNQEKGFLEIQLYGNKNEILHLDLKEFCDVLNKAKEYLSPSNINDNTLKNNAIFKFEKYNNGYSIYYEEIKIGRSYLLENHIELDIMYGINGYLLLPFIFFLNALKYIGKISPRISLS